MTKRCSRCKVEKSVAEFSRRSKSSDGLQGHCKVCASEAWKAFAGKNPEYVKAKNHLYKLENLERLRAARKPSKKNPVAAKSARYRYRYGVTTVQVTEQLQMQNGLCALCLCRLHDRGRVDHCHRTGVLRGMVCHSCNVRIGIIEMKARYPRTSDSGWNLVADVYLAVSGIWEAVSE